MDSLHERARQHQTPDLFFSRHYASSSPNDNAATTLPNSNSNVNHLVSPTFSHSFDSNFFESLPNDFEPTSPCRYQKLHRLPQAASLPVRYSTLSLRRLSLSKSLSIRPSSVGCSTRKLPLRFDYARCCTNETLGFLWIALSAPSHPAACLLPASLFPQGFATRTRLFTWTLFRWIIDIVLSLHLHFSTSTNVTTPGFLVVTVDWHL